MAIINGKCLRSMTRSTHFQLLSKQEFESYPASLCSTQFLYFVLLLVFFLELFPKSFFSKRVSRVLLSRETPDSLSKSFFDQRHLQKALFKLELRE